MSRGHIEFCRKYVMVREAGAAGLVVVGDDPAADKYHAPCPCIHTGAFLSPDLEPRLASVAHVEFPAVYVLKKSAPCLPHYPSALGTPSGAVPKVVGSRTPLTRWALFARKVCAQPQGGGRRLHPLRRGPPLTCARARAAAPRAQPAPCRARSRRPAGRAAPSSCRHGLRPLLPYRLRPLLPWPVTVTGPPPDRDAPAAGL